MSNESIIKLIKNHIKDCNSIEDLQEKSGYKLLEIELYQFSKQFKKFNKKIKQQLTNKEMQKLKSLLLKRGKNINTKKIQEISDNIKKYFDKEY